MKTRGIKKIVVVATMLIASIVSANAANIVSIKSGNWSDPTVWDLNRVPLPTDNVHIDHSNVVTIPLGITTTCQDVHADNGSRLYVYGTLNCRDFYGDNNGNRSWIYGRLNGCSMYLDNGCRVYGCSNIYLSNCTNKIAPIIIQNGARLLPLGGAYCNTIAVNFDVNGTNIDLTGLCAANVGIQTLNITNATVTMASCNNIVDYVQLNHGGDVTGTAPTWTGVSKLAINRDYTFNSSSVLWQAGTGNVPHTIDILSGTININAGKTVVTRMQLLGGTVYGGTNLAFADNSYLFRCGGVLNSAPIMGTNVTVEMCSDTNRNNPPAVLGTEMPASGFTGDLIISTNVILGSNISVPVGKVVVTSTGTLNDSNFNVGGATSVTVDSGGVVVTSNATGLTGTSSLFGVTPLTLSDGSTVIYSGSAGTQTVTPRADYYNLVLNDSSVKVLTASTYTVSGDFTVSGGAVTVPVNNVMTFDGTGTQQVAGLKYYDVNFKGTGTKQLTSTASVTSSLDVAAGTVVNTNNNLTLLSTASGTAQVGPLLNGADITGNVCWMRYIPGGSKNRRWRFLSCPVKDVTFRWWQNDIFITGPGTGGVPCNWNTTSTASMHQNSNGFDQNQSTVNSCFTWNESTATWQTISRAFDTINPLKAYRTFVRGDRNIEGCLLMTFMPDSVSGVTLRSCGPIVKFTQSVSLTYTPGTGNGWNYVSNPYPCSVNWADPSWVSTRSSSINPTIYIFDPLINQYCTWNPIAGATNGGTNIIGTGQSFFVKTNATTNLVFEESYKVDSGQIGFFGKGNATAAVTNNLKISLRGTETKDEAILYFHRGATMNFEDTYDGYKMGYTIGSIALSSNVNVSKLSFSGIAPVTAIDTVIINTNLSNANAVFTFDFNGINTFESQYVLLLRDKFLNTITNLLTNRTYTFSTIAGNAGSYDQGRFEIIVMNASSLPVTISEFSAEKQSDNSVMVKWSTASETNNSHFIVEHSIDGINFKQLEVVKGAGNSTSTKNYSYIHTTPVNSINYYRLVQVDMNNSDHYSYVVAVNLTEDQAATLVLFPMPAENILNISFSNSHLTGNVIVKVFDLVGREVISKPINVTGKNHVASIDIAGLTNGSYFMSVLSQNGTEQKMKFIKN